MTQSDRYDIIGQIINALKYAHQRKILHRDISPNNVLMFFKEGLKVLKMSDFGLGKDTESLSYYTGSSASGYGQILYVSPEQGIHLRDATEKSDIYSLGKLVYFVFTGKDPVNIKPFELSSLVAKATEENPEDRFQTIEEFESHFNALKELLLNQSIPIEHITLKEVVDSGDAITPIKLHELLVKGNYIDHVYQDYISPVNTYLLYPSNLEEYYKVIGSGIRDFVKTYTDRLNECYQTTRWPFSSMKTFGKLLKKIIETVIDDETRLMCLKQLWYLAFEADQWDVQKEIKGVLNEKYISKSIETQLSEYIISTEMEVDMSHFANLQLPRIVKLGVLKSNDIAVQRKVERDKKRNEELEDTGGELDW